MILKKLGLASDFNKNVVMLFAGTAIAQAIPVAISPILTRLYSPEEFGLFALFFSISNLLGVIATARYELAIVLPKDEEDANKLEKLCYVISVLIGLVLMVIVLLLHDTIVKWLES
jgi:O-antigen/teichoic acid export membrane protein